MGEKKVSVTKPSVSTKAAKTELKAAALELEKLAKDVKAIQAKLESGKPLTKRAVGELAKKIGSAISKSVPTANW